jgi:hypothetical protein
LTSLATPDDIIKFLGKGTGTEVPNNKSLYDLIALDRWDVRLPATRAARIDNLDVLLSSRLSKEDFDTKFPDARVARIDDLVPPYTTKEIKIYPLAADTAYALSSATPFGWGDWAEVIPANTVTEDFIIVGIMVWIQTVTAARLFDIQLGVGAPGSEVPIATISGANTSAANGEGLISGFMEPFPIPRKVPANSRISVRANDSEAIAYYYGVKVQYIGLPLKIEEIGSFLLGGYSSPRLGYGVLCVPPSISRTGNLSDVVPVDETIRSIGANGVYWLIGFDRYLYKFDGVNWTLLDDEGTTDVQFGAVKWNGEYWLIALRSIYPYPGWSMLAKYDGETYTILEESYVEDATFYGLAWSPTLNYWLIVGSSYALPTVGKTWKWDGTTLTDISDTINWGSYRIYVAEWHPPNFLLGGAPYESYGKLMKFDGTTATTICDPWIGPMVGEILTIKCNGTISLLGTGHYEDPSYAITGQLLKWDGENLLEITTLPFNIHSIDYAEGLWLIGGTLIVSNYIYYHYASLRSYVNGVISEVTPPWTEAGNRILAVAYNPYVFG